jgi:exopolysaccharide biosynthesis predicted pyruvyltransferase EpsI
MREIVKTMRLGKQSECVLMIWKGWNALDLYTQVSRYVRLVVAQFSAVTVIQFPDSSSCP